MNPSAKREVLIDTVIPNLGALRFNRLGLAINYVDIALVLGFTFFIALCAQISIKIPTTTVPITGQTFGVLLTSGTLGSKRGTTTALLYMILGMAGLPIFAPSSSIMKEKALHFILPWSGTEGAVWEISSGGYIVGFILASYIVGRLAEQRWDRGSQIVIAMILGNVAIYLVGLPWLAAFISSGTTIPLTDLTYYDAISGNNVLDKTLRGGFYPFIAGDAIKLLLAATAFPLSWRLTKWFTNRNK